MIWFLVSDIKYAIHTDASYLSEPNAKSCDMTHFHLNKENNLDLNNQAIFTLSSITKQVIALVSKAEFTALFYHCKYGIPLLTALKEMIITNLQH